MSYLLGTALSFHQLRPQPRLGVALVAVLLSMALVGSVVAQVFPGPKRMEPHEVSTPPDMSRANLQSPPADRRWLPLSEMQRRLGVPLLVPAAVPPGCTEQERFFWDGPGVANLLYSCFHISEQAGEHIAQPDVPPGAVQHVAVDGRPAIYIEGSWANGPNGKTVWNPESERVVMFERDGLILQVRSAPEGDLIIHDDDGRIVRVPNSYSLGRDELIHIADSLVPLQQP
jgi:hypothetical protein